MAHAPSRTAARLTAHESCFRTKWLYVTMAARRRDDDPGGIARALNLVADRWASLVVRELIHGPKRSTDLRTGLPGVSANVLSWRLDDLADRGIVAQRHLGPPARAEVYAPDHPRTGVGAGVVGTGHVGQPSRPTRPG